VIVVGTIVLVQYVTHRRRNDFEISYNEFVQQLERDNIAAMQVTNRRVRGQLKAAVRQGDRSTDSFATTLPFEPNDTWVAALVQKGVEVRGEQAHSRRPWPVVVLSFLPYVLILFLVIVMLRRMQGEKRL
jgi:cell division protease FtsH